MEKITKPQNLIGQRDLLLFLVRLFNQSKINYLLTGSLAVSYYGYPRATHDIDFIIEVRIEDCRKLISAFKRLSRYFLIDEGEIEQAVKKTSQFNLYHVPTGIKIDFWISKNSAFDIGKFKRKKAVSFDNEKVALVSAEDLILTKLLWSKEIESEKHSRDCHGILKIQKDKLDKRYLNYWIKTFNLRALFRKISSMD